MIKTRRKFAKEFKLAVLQELEQKSLAQVCREHELNPNVVSRWKREYQQNPQQAFSGNGKLWKEDARIAQYERLIGQLYTEIAFLKKVNAAMQQRRAEEKLRCTR
jgi:transposase